MQYVPTRFANPIDAALRLRPDLPLACFCPQALTEQARRFGAGFDGLTTYAVKANPAREVLETLVAAGVGTFDTASIAEMRAVRAVAPGAALHYHNPVRSPTEIAEARGLGVASWSVDDAGELAKIAPGPGDEIAVRLALRVPGAAYDFGAKFGAPPAKAADLLRRAADRGARASITFHPGTQCDRPEAWRSYVMAAAEVAQAAGVRLHRLNVGGGFAGNRDGTRPDLERVFATIAATARQAFEVPPVLVCEPGRALVSEAVTLITRVKAIRTDGTVFLNDGLYGGLAELRDMPVPRRMCILGPEGRLRSGARKARVVFGPTCDSVDRLPGEVGLPVDMQPGDFLLWPGMGAYALALNTGFNGYGVTGTVTVASGLS